MSGNECFNAVLEGRVVALTEKCERLEARLRGVPPTPMDGILREVRAEVNRANDIHGGYHSAHEAYAVLLEEVDEFWEEVRRKRSERSPARMREELVQVAAVAVRAIEALAPLEETS